MRESSGAATAAVALLPTFEGTGGLLCQTGSPLMLPTWPPDHGKTTERVSVASAIPVLYLRQPSARHPARTLSHPHRAYRPPMETQITNVIQAFQNSKQYVIPSYQRNYVWTREGQWDPLWEDVKALVARHLKDGVEIEPHFLGTIITKVIDMDDGHVSRSWVVDGQQRLTTLQVLLGAARATFIERGLNRLAGVLSGCLVNDEDLVIRPKDRYKIDHKGGDRDEPPGDHQSDYRSFTSIVDAALSSQEAPADGSPAERVLCLLPPCCAQLAPPGLQARCRAPRECPHQGHAPEAPRGRHPPRRQ